MPRPLEKNIVKAIMKRLRGLGACVVKIHGGPFQAAGFPDLFVLISGRVILLEVKTPKGRVSAIQATCHRAMRAAGGSVFVVRSADEAKEAVLYGQGDYE